MADKLLDEMQHGDKIAILNGLSHSGAIYRMNAVAYAAIFKINGEEAIKRLRALKNDNVDIMGYLVSDFAIASLDMLGAEKYNGADSRVKELIESRFIFMLE